MIRGSTYLVTQRAKKNWLSSSFAVFEAASKAEAIRLFEEKGFGVSRDSPVASDWCRPTAQELEWGVKYRL